MNLILFEDVTCEHFKLVRNPRCSLAFACLVHTYTVLGFCRVAPTRPTGYSNKYVPTRYCHHDVSHLVYPDGPKMLLSKSPEESIELEW